MKFATITLALVTLGCGNNAASKEFNIKGFEKYYNNFSSVGNVKTDNLVIKFHTLGQPGAAPNTHIMGLCISEAGVPTILVDPRDWIGFTEGQRYELIWHELGHCVLGRLHNDAKLLDGNPASIMNSQAVDPKIISNNALYYRDELFGDHK